MLRLLLWPITLFANVVGLLFRLTGRTLGFCLGLLMLIGGGALCLTIIGAIIGAPLAILGLGMMAKTFW